MEITVTEKILRELQLIYYLYALQLSDTYDDSQWFNVTNHNGEHISGRFMDGLFAIYSEIELFNIQRFKQIVTDRFERAANQTLILNQSKEIRDKAASVLRFFDESMSSENNPKIKEFFRWKKSANTEDGNHSAGVFVREDISIHNVVYGEYTRPEPLPESLSNYKFQYLLDNSKLKQVCDEIVDFLDPLIPEDYLTKEERIIQLDEQAEKAYRKAVQRHIDKATAYFKRKIIDGHLEKDFDKDLLDAAPQLIRFIESLHLFRDDKVETETRIANWQKSKTKYTFNWTNEDGETVEVDKNPPDETEFRKYLVWLWDYFRHEYENKAGATISYAYALESLTVLANQRIRPATELPNTREADILAAIAAEDSGSNEVTPPPSAQTESCNKNAKPPFYKWHTGTYDLSGPQLHYYHKIIQYEYIPINGYGDMPFRRSALLMYCMKDTYREPQWPGRDEIRSLLPLLPDMGEYARGFIAGYNSDFKPFINTVDAMKRMVVKAARGGRGGVILSQTPKGDIEFEHLYREGHEEGERYKAWEIILQTPDEFSGYFSNDTAPESVADKGSGQRDAFPPSLLKLKADECQCLYVELTKDGHFLPNDTNQAHFNYVFGGGVCPEDFAPLIWNVSKMAFSELYILLSGNKSMPNEIQRNAARLLFTKKGSPLDKLQNLAEGKYSADRARIDSIVNAINATKTHPT
jgi:hypothetical protein